MLLNGYYKFTSNSFAVVFTSLMLCQFR